MIRLLTVLSAVGMLVSLGRAGTPNELTPAEQRSGWRLLFDGKSADEWRSYHQQTLGGGWVIDDGALTRATDGAGNIITRDQFDRFELQIDYRIAPGGNSGIMFHVTEETEDPGFTGPEVQLLDNVAGTDPQRAGWLYQLYKPVKPEWAIRFENQVGFSSPEVADATRPAGQWNHVYLRVDPRQSEVCVNGVSYYYFQKGSDDWNARVAQSKFADMPLFGKADRGHICLQDHGAVISFRNIKIREIDENGNVPEPIDGTLPVTTKLAFPNVTWEGWQPIDDDGRLNPPLRPIHITHAGDGSNRVFVVDQSGMIHVLPNDPAVAEAKLFADLRPRTHQFRIDDEEGMLGFAFHPRYAENGEFFVYYSPESQPRGVRLSRLRVSSNDPNQFDPDFEEVLWEFEQPFANHNGGPMAFGSDGYLYLGLGDGGGRNDPMGLAQNLTSPMGCLLRIDVDHRSTDRPYAIPEDNPFIGRSDVLPEIYAYGLRNPWRMGGDRETGTLWFADVGQDLWEEIDIVTKGANYGWSIREGTYNFGNAPGAEDAETTDPIWQYDHRIGKSITGGHVYRGKAIPELVGHYLYGDYVAGKLWALQYDQETGEVIRNMSIPWNGQPVLSFGEDEAGESFVTMPSQKGEGIYRIVRQR